MEVQQEEEGDLEEVKAASEEEVASLTIRVSMRTIQSMTTLTMMTTVMPTWSWSLRTKVTMLVTSVIGNVQTSSVESQTLPREPSVESVGGTIQGRVRSETV